MLPRLLSSLRMLETWDCPTEPACSSPTKALLIPRTYEDGLNAIFLNLYKPPKIPATDAAAIAAGRLREIQAYEVSAKSKMRLKGAMLIAKFYDDVGHPLDPANMAWPVIKRFLEQWKALMERKKVEIGTPPKITKN